MGYPRGGTRITLLATLTATAAFFICLASPTHAAGIVIINEIMWDGTEYIELHNTTDNTLSLANWSLKRQAAGGEIKTITTFADDDAIAARGYFLIEKSETATAATANKIVSALTLLNTGEQLTLLHSDGTVVDTANQLGTWFAGANTETGTAMERTTSADGTLAANWHTASSENSGRLGTPGLANSVPIPNQAPEAVIAGPTGGKINELLTLSAEDSSDADGNTLTYSWTFGDDTTGSGGEVTHTYPKAGTYTVRLTVSDSELEDETTHTVVVTTPVYSSDIVINEVLPNPTGSDTTGEFIELKNLGSNSVDLTGWKLDDEDSGSTPYTIPATTTINGNTTKLFLRAESKIALNNDGDSVRLIDPAGVIRASVTYDNTLKEGWSYNLPVGKTPTTTAYRISTTLTPGAENIITDPEEEEDEDTEEEEDSSTTGSSTTTGRVAGSTVSAIALADVRDEEAGTELQTEGVVSVPPGILGKNIFYLAGSGIQVYFSKANWPALKLGDKIKVTGTLSSNRGEARLKLAQATDITTITAGPPPVPHQIETGDIDEALEGSLVVVQGEVTETSGDTFFIDDGSGEIKIVINSSTKIDKPAMKKGTAVTITGVVSETTSGFRILPRFQEDIRFGLVAGLTSFPATGTTSATDPRVLLPLFLAVLLFAHARHTREPLVTRTQ